MIKLIVSGRVGQDAELKSVGDTTVCSFSVAHTEKVYGPNPSEKTVWVSCNVWGERGEKLKPFITKGTYIVVEGSGGVNAYTKRTERQLPLLTAVLPPLNLEESQPQNLLLSPPCRQLARLTWMVICHFNYLL
jgi:single-strand DNA-binding protein